MIRCFFAVMLVIVFSACTARVTPPKLEVDVPGVEVGSSGSQGKFCPPGQAKKGRC